MNHKPGVPRDVLHRFRATLFQIERWPSGQALGAQAKMSRRRFVVSPATCAWSTQRVGTLVASCRRDPGKHRGKPSPRARPHRHPQRRWGERADQPNPRPNRAGARGLLPRLCPRAPNRLPAAECRREREQARRGWGGLGPGKLRREEVVEGVLR